MTRTIQISHPRPRRTNVDRGPTQPTQNVQNEIIRLRGHQLGPRGHLTRTTKFRIHDRVRPSVNREPTQQKSNGCTNLDLG